MILSPSTWKTKHIVYSILILLTYYIFFVHKNKYESKMEGVIDNVHPLRVWEFVADFSNMKLLNPLIIDFDIIEEAGNLDNWEYTVEYTEKLGFLPFVKNHGTGQYTIKPDGDAYLIISSHVTCFPFSYSCMKSTSEFRFEKYQKTNTKCIETVKYQCPIIMIELCHEEVKAQRKEIMGRLKAAFQPMNSIRHTVS